MTFELRGAPRETQPSTEPISVSSPILVLIVEDEETVRMIAVSGLRQAGFHILEAENAEEALLLLEKSSGIDAVLTNLQVPGTFNGLELARAVRGRWPSIAVLLTSGGVHPESGALPDGVTFIPKPYRHAQIVRQIVSHVSRHRQQESKKHG